ncbi:MAG TPA: hypothetical protein VM490_20060 [Armatimonadaceae bacterium]|nr:hypothetical protein [Armatimonadaceae bacterium]
MMQRLATDFDWATFLKRHDLVYERVPGRWEEGPFLGNGLLGALLYNRPESHENPASLRFDVGRSDVAERHPRGRHRLPIGFLTLAPSGRVAREFSGRLVLWDALWEGKLSTDLGHVAFRAFVHAEENVLVVEAEPGRGESVVFEWHPTRSLNPRSRFRRDVDPMENPAPITETREDGVVVCIQPLEAGGECAVAHLVRPGDRGRRTLFLSVGFTYAEPGGAEQAVEAVRRAASQGVEALRRGHDRWWHGYYPQSFLSVPDTRLESFYWIQMYKLASATRADRPALDLMGPWFRETPWPALRWNGNLQLAYSPVYAANRLHLGESLLRLLDDNRERLTENAPEEWRCDSAAVAGVTGYDGVGPVRPAPDAECGNLTWALHTAYLHYRHGMDDDYLRASLFPLLRRAVGFYGHLTEEGEDGFLHLPSSRSPGSASAAPDCCYDLALLRWACQTLLAVAGRLGIDDPEAPRWLAIDHRLTPYPSDESQGYLIGRGVPLERPDVYPAHLLMIHPLRLTSTERPEERALAERSLDHWLGLDGASHGYACTGGAAVASILGRREQAASLLNEFIDRHVLPNTMYLEGGHLEAGPVLDAPLAGANALQEMLLRAEPDGSFRVFPAVPDSWRDSVFHEMRAPGAFLVSARRSSGRTEFVRVRSLAGESCRVRADFHGPVEATFQNGRRVPATPAPDGSYPLDLRKGDTVFLAGRGANVDLRLRPVAPMPGAFLNWFGVRR